MGEFVYYSTCPGDVPGRQITVEIADEILFVLGVAIVSIRELEIATPWLGASRGRLSDWITQRWVQISGSRISFKSQPWLDGPSGDTLRVGSDFFDRLATSQGLSIDEESSPRGLLDDFSALAEPRCSLDEVSPEVMRFYERTSEYELDVWSQWCGAFQPFGSVLAALFSRRLQQLNVPLSPLETSMGISNRVIKLRGASGSTALTAWVRELKATGNTLYSGSYDICDVPGEPSPCMRVVFPLPNGSAVVIMRPAAQPDGSLIVSSDGSAFGGAGFYLVVRSSNDSGWVRCVRSLKESIRVFIDPEGVLRADHHLNIFGRPFLKLHYRMSRVA